MKLVSFLLFITCVHVSASTKAQNISLSLKNEALSKVFKAIEKQTDFVVVYNDRFVRSSKRVSIKVDNVPLKNALNVLLDPLSLTYHITEDAIVITPSSEKNSEALSGKTKIVKQRAITGKIKDEEGMVLQGVTISAKGTSRTVISDANGNYRLVLPNGADTLVFSNVGYKTIERAIGHQENIDVTLEAIVVELDQIVAVGYGTMHKRDLTGSISSVSGSDLKDIPVTSTAEALTGRIAGVQITRSEGSPDADFKIRIRGGGSLTQDNSPLYIVDGFPVDNINDISPTDIASIDVLKDASSTAIYGARGANGVILITTKIGKAGKGTVTYNNYFGVKNITKTLDVLSPYEYVFWQYEVDEISTQLSTFERYYGDFRDIDLYKQMTPIDWQDRLFGRTGTSGFHNLAFSGGQNGNRYNISLTRNDDEEIMLGSGSNRTNLNVRTTNKVNDWLSIDLNARLSDNHQKGAGTSSNNRLSHAVQYRPIHGLSDYVDPELADPGEFEASVIYNRDPIKQTIDDYRRYKRLSFDFSGAASVQLTRELKYRLEYGNSYRESTNKNFYGLNTTNVNNYGGLPFARIAEVSGNRQRLANVLTYRKRNIHPGGHLTATLGQELVSERSNSIINLSRYFPKYIDAVSALSMMQLGTADPILTAEDPANKLSSFFGRVNYDYLGKYLISGTFRADGSSKFAEGNQWGYFPSVALAWRINEELFMFSTEEWLSDLKLRVSYGQSGNNRITDNAWQKTFSVATGDIFLSGDESTHTPFLAPDGVLSNPKLKWETTETKNIGLDFGFLNQRISGSVEVYKNITRDLLISATIPASTGYSTQWQNIGQTSNKGIEVAVAGDIIRKKDFTLSASFNISFNRNKIDRLGEAKEWEQNSMWYGWIGTGTIAADYLVKEGGQVGQMYGYQTDGMYTFDDFNYDPVAQTYTLKDGVPSNESLLSTSLFWPGALRFKNQNDDLVIDSEDKVIIGNANPKHIGGFNLSGQYKGIDFSAFFNWVYGNDIYNANKIFFTSQPFGYKYRNMVGEMTMDNRFTYYSPETGNLVSDPTALAEMNKDAKMWFPGMSTLQLHSWAIEDGSFLRLNTLTIGYSFPASVLNRLKLSQLRIYASGYNLWTWTNYSGYDPEVDVIRRTPLTPGVDWSAYPRSRTYNVGLNVGF
ncbi:TonB-dependent receptor [Sphingobacterium sp. SGG-5]|uniref:TonB-dependent receptor n=1 Tax=Sphingobacterium sp. SGG-5 TaxID=2710881 RepID=UPI0013EA8028|nr:TonB-dependent receptor [Sphingobacterium sp. SGG-5]NGM62464.1 TonB-dependent receptor [Sphingobacterium sp. SGG-5]